MRDGGVANCLHTAEAAAEVTGEAGGRPLPRRAHEV